MFHRHSIRLPKYDYSQSGYYFVTICTQNRECLLGEIVDGEMKLNDAGNIVNSQWNELLNRFHNVELDEYVVMPNHMHIIIQIHNHVVMGRDNPAPNNKKNIPTQLL